MTNHPTCDPCDPETEQRLVDDRERVRGKAIASANTTSTHTSHTLLVHLYTYLLLMRSTGNGIGQLTEVKKGMSDRILGICR